MKSGLYQIRNIINGKRYIGSSNDVARRLTGHRRLLTIGCHTNKHLQSAVNKYGIENFVFEKLEAVPLDDLLKQEQEAIDTKAFEYNISPTAGSPRGCRHTEEAKRRIGAAAIGRKFPPKTDEQRKRLSEALKGRSVWNKKEHPERTCEVCGGKFTVKPHKVAEGKAKFCSKQCKHDSQRGICLSPQTQFKPGFTPWNKKLPAA